MTRMERIGAILRTLAVVLIFAAAIAACVLGVLASGSN